MLKNERQKQTLIKMSKNEEIKGDCVFLISEIPGASAGSPCIWSIDFLNDKVYCTSLELGMFNYVREDFNLKSLQKFLQNLASEGFNVQTLCCKGVL